MTKLLLSCDDYIFKYNQDYYTSTESKIAFYNRYLRVFDSMRIVARTKVLINEPGSDYSKINDDRIDILPFPFFQGPNQFAKVYFKGKRILKNVTKGCDAAIIRIPSATAYQVLPYLIKYGLPLGIEVVIDPYDLFKSTNNLFNRIFYWSWYKDLLKACRHSDGVSCVTRNYLQQRYFPSKLNSFTSYYSSIELTKNCFTSYRSYPHKKSFALIHVSGQVKFEGRKGHKEIIDALSIVNKKGFDVCVNFVGGDYENGIYKLTRYAENLGIQQKVNFIGYLKSETEILNQLINGDVFVMPTKSEGLPRAIIEAMATGLPCITTDVSGNSELIQKRFLLNDFYDIDSLAQLIIDMVSKPELYESASRYNFYQSQQYESTVLQSRRDEFYKKLLEKSKSIH